MSALRILTAVKRKAAEEGSSASAGLQTIRQALSGFKNVENLQDPCELLGSKISESWFCASEDGALDVICGGRCIMGFTPNTVSQWSIYLVIDDSEGIAWDVKRQGGVAIGSRPHSVLRLVQSA